MISNNKYDSGSGWPSYNQPVNNSALKEIDDFSLGVIRTEVKCANCDAHLGHVFPDGPNGLPRYCINATVLEFKNRKEIDKS